MGIAALLVGALIVYACASRPTGQAPVLEPTATSDLEPTAPPQPEPERAPEPPLEPAAAPQRPSARTFIDHELAIEFPAVRALAIGDMDGDGDGDVVTASVLAESDNRTGGAISWHENLGGKEPRFAERPITRRLPDPKSLLVLDFDADGDIDVLAASTVDDRIIWLESDGADPPAFAERLISHSEARPRSIDTGDMDGDGDLDVIVAAERGNSVVWLEHRDGAFERRVVSQTAERPVSVFAADLDSDGDVDVLSASLDSGEIAWHENSGLSPPSFTQRTIASSRKGVSSVAAGDLDGDGDADVIVGASHHDTLTWFANDGASPPRFERRLVSRSRDYVVSASPVDLDGDGALDLFTVGHNARWVGWYRNDGRPDPTLQSRVVSALRAGHAAVAAGDLDRDGLVDLVSASRGSFYVAGSPPVGKTALVWHHQVALARGLDLVLGAGPTPMEPQPVASRPVEANTPASLPPPIESQINERFIGAPVVPACSVAGYDLDRDGDTDVVAGLRMDDGGLAWFESDGQVPPSFVEHRVETDVAEVCVATLVDIDRDGDMDLLASSFHDGSLAWFENDGGSPPRFETRPLTEPNWREGTGTLVVADLDADGDTDFATARSTGVHWYENDGASPPQFEVREVSDGRHVSVAAADFDGDGSVDLVGLMKPPLKQAGQAPGRRRPSGLKQDPPEEEEITSDQVVVYLSDGQPQPTFAARPIAEPAREPTRVAAGDIDHDGDIDVVTVGDTAVAVYDNQGGLVFEGRVIATRGEGSTALSLADADADGHTDILVGWSHSNTISLYRGDGRSPVVFEEITLSTRLFQDPYRYASGIWTIATADVDNDGDLDVLSVSPMEGRLVWHEMGSYQP